MVKIGLVQRATIDDHYVGMGQVTQEKYFIRPITEFFYSLAGGYLSCAFGRYGASIKLWNYVIIKKNADYISSDTIYVCALCLAFKIEFLEST
jgi:hypothetical protein